MFLLGAKITKLVLHRGSLRLAGLLISNTALRDHGYAACGASLGTEGVCLLSSTKYNTCGQITVAAQGAVPGQTSSAASQKLREARRGLGGNLKVAVRCQYGSASRAFSRFFLYLDKPPPAGWVKES